ncbi:EamA-like transporter family protein [Verrucomicrobium sp. GAS474]|uniref:DMT family transporter n=1 Tax=Verrucomicrobium sp. GAS474 TaxID=1882831 RepID=UPI00087CF9B5|nr:DMT family transporter [Verrucomicrobium sp. GAS474]SDU30631.1 EamA-like transporter family protein [Verrucomicrobium sp. GAS474]
MRHFLLLPLIAGIGYAVGTLFIKRAAAHGVGPWRTAFVCNMAVAVFSLPFFLLGAGGSLPWGKWYQPVIAAATFFIGQIFTFYAIEKGELSIATPILGTKVIFVALLTLLLIGVAVPLKLWLAAFLTAFSLVLLGGGKATDGSRRKFWLTALWAGLAAFHFGVTDTLAQKWAPGWGGARFSSVVFLVCALLSLGLIPFFHAPLRALKGEGRKYLMWGMVVAAGQGAILYYAIGRYGHATSINVVYNFRALATILLVWIVGHWFGNREGEAGHGVMARRLIGSALLLFSIGLVMS